MYICLLPQNQLLCQQAAIITTQLDHKAVHIPSVIMIEKGLLLEPGPRTLKISTLLSKSIVHRCIFVCCQ